MSFLHSGRTFLNQASIEASRFVAAGPGAFRRRPPSHVRLPRRTGLARCRGRRVQLGGILRLFVDFARYHPEFFRSVRAELAGWILHRVDPELSRAAEVALARAQRRPRRKCRAGCPRLEPGEWHARLVFDGRCIRGRTVSGCEPSYPTGLCLTPVDRACFRRRGLRSRGIADGGVWVSACREYDGRHSVRVSVNMTGRPPLRPARRPGRGLGTAAEIDSIYWHLAIANYPLGQRILPRVGAFRPDRGALGPFLLGRAQRLGADPPSRRPETRAGRPRSRPRVWRKLFIEGLARFFQRGPVRFVPASFPAGPTH